MMRKRNFSRRGSVDTSARVCKTNAASLTDGSLEKRMTPDFALLS
jgi:hypothetical protein